MFYHRATASGPEISNTDIKGTLGFQKEGPKPPVPAGLLESPRGWPTPDFQASSAWVMKQIPSGKAPGQ